jgi:phospholipid/cholesterol/gamma-HCH transport system permease protein
MLRAFEKLGDEFLYSLDQMGRMGIFLFTSIISTLSPPYKIAPIFSQIYFIGYRSLFVITFTGLFTGMVLSLQGYHTLTKFGSEGLLGSMVALSRIREAVFGP